jgi:hypothetical protein
MNENEYVLALHHDENLNNDRLNVLFHQIHEILKDQLVIQVNKNLILQNQLHESKFCLTILDF